MFEKQQINAVVFVNRIYLNHSQTILLQIYERRISLRGGCSFCFILKLSAGEFLFCNEYFISMLNYIEDATLLCSFAQTCLFGSQFAHPVYQKLMFGLYRWKLGVIFTMQIKCA